ncbi:MAG: hypothetical protein AAGG46_13280, partial [Planctomycetota bacterium]
AVRVALAQFLHQAGEGLIEIDAEMRRVMDYLEHDRPAFWKRQTRLAEDGVHNAKMELQRAMMFPVGVDERPACTEQRAALAKAEARLTYCRDKQERLRHWVREIAGELHDYQGRITTFRTVLEMDGPAAIGVLDRLLRAVERYAGSPATGTKATSVDEPSGGDDPVATPPADDT